MARPTTRHRGLAELAIEQRVQHPFAEVVVLSELVAEGGDGVDGRHRIVRRRDRTLRRVTNPAMAGEHLPERIG